MTDFPTELFIIPRAGDPEFEKLVTFVDVNHDEILAFFPWFTAEMLESFGAREAIMFLADNASKRLTLPQIFENLPASARFTRNVWQNSTDCQYVEMQSATGFFDVLRLFYISKTLTQPYSNMEIAFNTGTSIRCVQRLRKKLLSSQISHANVRSRVADL